MKAILVKYIPASNSRGSRYKVSAEGAPTRVYPYNYEKSSDSQCPSVATQYAKELGWSGKMIEGTLPNGDSCFVFTKRQ